MIIAWFSAGITSAVACKLALQNYEDVKCMYIETGSHHDDNLRFLRDVEKWLGSDIEICQSKKYSSVMDVILTRRFINGPKGALCTEELKKEVRRRVHTKLRPTHHVLGFDAGEIERASHFRLRHGAEADFLFPLIDFGLTKNDCAGIMETAGIALPEMYKLGYEHNNCIGCVKGGMGYWNKIRVDFPEVFNEMAAAEREIGRTCINGTFLDELDPKAGRGQKEVSVECGLFCQFQYDDLIK